MFAIIIKWLRKNKMTARVFLASNPLTHNNLWDCACKVKIERSSRHIVRKRGGFCEFQRVLWISGNTLWKTGDLEANVRWLALEKLECC